MSTKRLLDTLDGIAALVEAAGAKLVANGVRALRGLFVPGDTRSADAALSELKRVLSSEKRVIQDEYLSRLVDAGTDDEAFFLAHGELSKDKRIDKDAADAIAHAYTNGRDRWPSRKAALEAIRKKFVERAYQESKMRIVERYKLG